MKNARVKSFFSVILFFCLLFFLSNSLYSLSEKRKLGEIKLEKKEVSLQLKMAQKELSRLLYQIGKTNLEQKKIEKELAKIEFQIENKKEVILKLKRKIDVLKIEVENARKGLNNALVSFYKFNKMSFAEELLGAKNASDFLRKYKYFSLIVSSIKKKIIMARKKFSSYKDELKKLYSEQSELEKMLKRQNSLERKLMEKKKNYRKLVSLLSQRKKEYEIRLKELEKEEAKLKNIISQKLKARKAEEEKRKKEWEAKKRQLAEQKAKHLALKNGKKKKTNNKQKMIWPLGNISQVVSKFGKSKDAVGLEKHNTGIDILSPKSEPVKAILDGVVIYRGYMSGYGNIVILDHGNELVSVYANLDSIEVGINEKVKQGDIVGRSKQGENFHFEIRVNSDPQDPLKWLM